MHLRQLRTVACGILLLISMIAFLQHLTQLGIILNREGTDDVTNRKRQSGLQVLEPAQFNNQSDVNCVNAILGNLSFPMCIYNPQIDIFVSRMVIAGKYFEPDLVLKILKFFCIHPDLTFVDLGANLGTYSLPIAHSGIHVVSVEPHKDTVRRLAKSVHLGRIENNVDIFHYALSNEESTTFLKFNARNRGDTFMVGNGSCPGCLSVKMTVLNKLIPFIRHKKAFIKIDTQEAEIKIFQRKGAAMFFDEIDVVMILMEWVLYPQRYNKTEDGRRKVDRFLEFFYQRGYEVYDPRTEKKLDANWAKWSYDVLFKKEDLQKNQLFLI